MNPFFYARKAWLYAGSLYKLSETDIIMAFYPKTGSTWVRFFLYNILRDKPLGSEPPSFNELNKYMAEYGNPSMFNTWPFEDQPRLIKTHRPYSRVFRNNKSMMVVRDPRDIMVSFYHYAKENTDFSFDGSMKEMIHHPRMGMEVFFQHYKSWRNNVSLIKRYEDLKEDPLSNFADIADFCQINTSRKKVKRAVKQSSVKNVRKAQQKSELDHLDDEFTFARKATSSQWKDYFDNSDLKEFHKLCEKYEFDLYT
ncbi:Sulfotransferase domain superfamily [Salinibacter ruber DSM 13855]|uniref:Sulfotransferase domain superfamily n=1 Tax=Salinibacter ruber (strain DSM 13855 / M31) TaxID=309807 RepID=Q2S4X4_SALRD|nr:Sulfotransferase domain superfamily [Salinibacter ruber DSM 13855]